MIKVNDYFEGNVKSLGFEANDGPASVGVMAPGDYQFGTGAPERMTVVKGCLVIKRVDDADWLTFHAGEHFDVLGNSSFELKVSETTAYLCEYL